MTERIRRGRRAGIAAAAAAVVVGALVGGLWAATRTDVYEATTDLTVGNSTASTVLGAIASSPGDTRTVQLTQSRLLNSQLIRDTFAAKYGHTPDIDVATVTDSSLITVAARGKTPDDAAELANRYVDVYLGYLRQGVSGALTGAIDELVTERDRVARDLQILDDALAGLPPAGLPTAQAAQAGRRGGLQDQLASLNHRIQDLTLARSAPPTPVSVATPAQPPDGAANTSWPVAALYGALLTAFLAAAAFWARRALVSGRFRTSGSEETTGAFSSVRAAVPPAFALSTIVDGVANSAEMSRFARIRGDWGERPVLLVGHPGTDVLSWMNAVLTYPDPDPVTARHASRGSNGASAESEGAVRFVEFSGDDDGTDNSGELFVLSLSKSHGPTVDVSVSGRRTILLYDDAGLIPRA